MVYINNSDKTTIYIVVKYILLLVKMPLQCLGWRLNNHLASKAMYLYNTFVLNITII